jgi:SAM-dependent methyltransferase
MATNWLREFLNVNWLRPENAMWRTVNTRALEDRLRNFEHPSIDLGCGDGTTAFLRAGGSFKLTFDRYFGVGNIEEFFEDEDIYDAAPDEYEPDIERRPDYTISVGLDHKPALLEKSRRLDLYEELVEHDNNDPLPFEDDEFRTIFSNTVYWVENVGLHLEEIRRVLHPEGLAILVLRTPHVHTFLDFLQDHSDEIGGETVHMIDRGRSEHYPSLYDMEGWTRKLEGAGLSVVERLPMISVTHAGMWDIGLRPISPLLIPMANSLPIEQRTRIKKEWINLWMQLLSQVCEPMFEMGASRPPAEIAFVVENDGTK